MIQVLENPKTDKYLQFKKFILSKEFAWRYNISTNMDFYSHVFLQRPELAGYTLPNSSVTNENLQVLAEIIDHNGLYKDIPYFLEVKSCADYLKMKMHDIDIYKKWNNKV